MKLAILHTTPATLDPLKALAAELLPGYEVVNIMDDSILPQLAQHAGNLEVVADRFVQYSLFAEAAGADAVLCACSSVGELVPVAQQRLSVPIVRIDEAMAEEAVRRGARIGVAATLRTTLNPTLNLLRRKAAEAGREVELEPLLVDAAFQKLVAGDKEGHDSVLFEALSGLVRRVDLVVLAQASMARVVPRFPESEQAKFFSSPRSGMERVRHVLEGGEGQ